METRTRRTQGKERTYRRLSLLGWCASLLLVALLLALVFGAWLMPRRVYGATMEPTLKQNDLVLVDRLAKYFRMPARGDIVLFSDGAGNDCLKRIIALPGEQVEIAEGRVFIDSRPLDESAYAMGESEAFSPMTVPEGAVFVLGDNRAVVYDSRTEGIGCVSYADILGELRFRIAPASGFALFY